jgi:hypothetical protein
MKGLFHDAAQSPGTMMTHIVYISFCIFLLCCGVASEVFAAGPFLPPVLAYSPGDAAEPRTITFTNNDSASLTIESILFSGAAAGDYFLSNDHCLLSILEPATSCSFDIYGPSSILVNRSIAPVLNMTTASSGSIELVATSSTLLLNNAPIGVINSTDRQITVSGDNLFSYKFRFGTGGYSPETPANVPIELATVVAVDGVPKSAGSLEMQQFIDLRTSPKNTVAIPLTRSDIDLVYLLNKTRLNLDQENIVTLEGVGVENISVMLKRGDPIILPENPPPPGIVSMLMDGGVLSKSTPGSFILRIPAVVAHLSLNPVSGSGEGLTVNGTLAVASGSTVPIDVAAGDFMIITAWAGAQATTYTIEVIFDGTMRPDFSYRSFFVTSPSPADDFIALVNTGQLTVSFRMNLNAKLFSSLAGLQDEIRRMPDEYPGEPFHRKAWRFIRDNRYHWDPLTGESWGHDPLLYFNSIGFGYCDDASSLYYGILTAAGYTARVWTLGGHVVPEVFIGRWEMYDPDLQVYYNTAWGGVAGIEELQSDPWLITEPFAPVSTDPYVYSEGVAALYSSRGDNYVEPFFHTLVGSDTSVSFSLPASGELGFPKVVTEPLRTAYGNNAPSYTDASLTIPQGISYEATAGLVGHAIVPREGSPVYLSVIGKDTAGVWQTVPATALWQYDFTPPEVTPSQQSGGFNNLEPLVLSVNEPAIVYYTTDGSLPTTQSLVYLQPIIPDGQLPLDVQFFAIDAAGNSNTVQRYPSPVTDLVLAVSAASPQVAGISVTFTASVSGGSGPYEFYFNWYNPNNASWYVGRDYNLSGSWTWDTNGLEPGEYSVRVWARKTGSENYEVYRDTVYSITHPQISGLTVTAVKPSPGDVGTPVVFTAEASGGSGSFEYYFTWYNPNSESWQDGRAFSASASWTWDNRSLVPGEYVVLVWARNAGSKSAHVSCRTMYLLVPPPPATGLDVVVTPASPQIPGRAITFTSYASGGSGSYEYYFTWYNPNIPLWYVGHAYNPTSNWTWDTQGLAPGDYRIEVWARSIGSSAAYEVLQAVVYTLFKPLKDGGAYFDTLDEAYLAAADVAVVQAVNGELVLGADSSGNFVMDKPKTITIEGGFDPAYCGNQDGVSVISGSVTVKNGKLVMKQVVLRR